MLTRLKSLFTASSPAPADKIARKKQGDEHLRGDRLAEATECYRQALSMDPDYVDAGVALGFALSEQKQYDEAGKHLRHAISIDPRNADAHYILGTVSRNTSDDAGAIEHFSNALAAKPDFEFAHRDLIAALFNSGRLHETREAVQKAISVYPESGEFRFHLGNVFRQEGDYDNAIASYETALSKQPDSAPTHKNLADVLAERGRLDQAVASYKKALWFAPDFVDAHVDFGGLLHLQGKHDQAVACYQRAIALQPEHAVAETRLGSVLEKLGRIDEAIAAYRRAVALEPDNALAHQVLGNALLRRGAAQEAIVCYEQVLRLDPESPAKHMITALTGHDSERAPSDYVEKLFDYYADTFDSHLVNDLNYRDPQKLTALLGQYQDPAVEKWVALDLGCGTGLSGAALAPHARQLVGVDLSAKMLDKARERNLYHRLEQLDVLTMMQGEAAASYDVVFATDVFIYVGKLDELVEQTQRLLRPGGFFAFSVESLDALGGDSALPEQRDYKLNVTARYAHSIAYLTRLAADNGFDVLSTTGTQSRIERGKPVQGYLALWRRPPA